ncbi:hypothetical protein CYY_008983 [Polysphondylium violaceum]|uniref:BLOC-1-related complex subunit 7 n=1 Tax=Polysphondylium violaceum TaxID=133409 RepID=A0A8J4PMJ2_9MYCE|nr:hypothetical protein CYY_008983 [Polysphondylium violaceum]
MNHIPFVNSQGHSIDDPSFTLKKELTEKGETIVNDLGKSVKSLVKNSNLHENIITIAKTFATHETNVLQTEEMIQQMSALSRELTSQVNLLHTSFQSLDGINTQVVNINKSAHSLAIPPTTTTITTNENN